jgi:lysophospholipase L1-like esterase
LDLPRSEARRHIKGARLLLAAVALALPLAAAEIGLAIYHSATAAASLAALPPIEQRAIIGSDDPLLRFEFNPGWSQGDFQINALGLADDATSERKPPGSFRVAVVGDSISANFALEPREVIFPTRLEALLAEAPRPEGIRRFEVLNLGVNGYALPQILQMARTRARTLGADAIVAQLCLNDPFTAQQGFANAPSDHPTRLIGFAARRLWRERALARTYVESRYTEQGWRNVESSLQGLAALSAELPVLAVLVPYLAPTAYERWGFERYHERIGASARAAGLALLDLREDFERAGLIDRGPGEDPIHPDPAGHELMAGRILDELESRGMLSLPRGGEVAR